MSVIIERECSNVRSRQARSHTDYYVVIVILIDYSAMYWTAFARREYYYGSFFWFLDLV